MVGEVRNTCGGASLDSVTRLTANIKRMDYHPFYV